MPLFRNKLHFAITHHTAAEIIYKRADSKKEYMGLTTWKNAPDGKILKSDTTVAKNYLSKEELSELNRVIVMYLDYAENQAERQIPMKMEDWVSKLNGLLEFNDYNVLIDAGKIKAKLAKSKAEREYKKFRVFQDESFRSDFDEFVEHFSETGELPSESEDKTIHSSFDKKLIKALNSPPPKKDGKS